MQSRNNESFKIAIIGLGYVGLPLAVEFAKYFDTIGYDINSKRINDLRIGIDNTGEISKNELKESKLKYSDKEIDLKSNNFYIVTVPTPIDNFKNPDFYYIEEACKLVSKYIQKGDIVVFESTVYPGATREICIPILEEISGLKLNTDFGIGYSPERINPGDKSHTIKDIVKLTSGSDTNTLDIVNSLYSRIIKAGTFKVSSIEVAETAKVIENTQRDINIALMNEFSMIFQKLNISSKEILEAANTKWNFLNFEPGLVGGHCIGVDPYYLTYKAKKIGMSPNLILAGREINDNMAHAVLDIFLKLALKRSLFKVSKKILLMGITFKENCPDIRNSKSLELLEKLIEYGLDVDVYDPVADYSKITNYKIISDLNTNFQKKYAGILITVKHEIFKSLNIKFLRKICVPNSIIFDLKGIYSNNDVDLTL